MIRSRCAHGRTCSERHTCYDEGPLSYPRRRCANNVQIIDTSTTESMAFIVMLRTYCCNIPRRGDRQKTPWPACSCLLPSCSPLVWFTRGLLRPCEIYHPRAILTIEFFLYPSQSLITHYHRCHGKFSARDKTEHYATLNRHQRPHYQPRK